ncbi:hypothetical protein [Kitasatospora sp. NPDC088779]|uniref:hypothetical protein n=1 Tax=Kitasatospora sp. NPDC088779 TaxID=3154964 RepID=UPI003443A640
MDINTLLRTFYTVERAGSELLSDGGGPLGFDIQVALQLDYLIRGYQVDGIVETGGSWSDVGRALGGITKQSAQKKRRTLADLTRTASAAG